MTAPPLKCLAFAQLYFFSFIISLRLNRNIIALNILLSYYLINPKSLLTLISYKDLTAKRTEREAKEQDKSQEEAGAPEPKARVARLSEAQVEEDENPLEPWRAPMARIW